MQFGARLVTGGFAGAVHRQPLGVYTFGRPRRRADRRGARHARRSRGPQAAVAANDGHDLPVALVEDAVAVLGGFAVAALTAVV